MDKCKCIYMYSVISLFKLTHDAQLELSLLFCSPLCLSSLVMVESSLMYLLCMHTSYHGVVDVGYTATCYVTACVTQISSPNFIHCWIVFLLGGAPTTVAPGTGISDCENTTSRGKGSGAGVNEDGDKIATMLIQRLDHVSDEVSAGEYL